MPVAIDGRRRLAPEARRQILLSHAVEIFSERGIGRGGHTEIAELGGVSVATVFNYFNTREALVDAVLQEVGNYFLSMASTTFQQISDPLQALREYSSSFLNARQSHMAYIRVWLEWSSSSRDETRVSYLEFDKQLTQLITNQIDKAIVRGQLKLGLPASDRAMLIISLAHMMSSMIIAGDTSPSDIDATFERSFNYILSVAE